MLRTFMEYMSDTEPEEIVIIQYVFVFVATLLSKSKKVQDKGIN